MTHVFNRIFFFHHVAVRLYQVDHPQTCVRVKDNLDFSFYSCLLSM